MGFSKRQACEAIRLHLTGEVWSAGGTFKLIKDEGHHRNTYEYIRDKQGPGTFVWTFRGEEHWMVKGKQKIAFEKDITPQF